MAFALQLENPAILRPKRWSHTFLDLCASCAAAAQAKVRGEPSVAPANVRGGSDLHEGIARLARACWEKGVTQDKEAAAHIADGYTGSVRTNLLAFARDARWPWRKLKGADMTECPVEQMWETALPTFERLVGRIDLCLVEKGAARDNPFAEGDDAVTIQDWKQGRPAAWNETEAPDQLLTYAVIYRLRQQWAWEARYFVTALRLGVSASYETIAAHGRRSKLKPHHAQQDFSLLYGAPGWSGKWASKAWTVGRTELDRHERRLVATIDRYLADEEWAAVPGEACARCLYTAACPLNGTRTFEVLTNSNLDELAAAKAWHAAKATEATKYLKACEKANGGPVVAAGVPWGWNQDTALVSVMDDAALDEHLRTKGHSLAELQTEPAYHKTKVAKAIKEGWLDPGLLVEEAAGKSFGPMKSNGNGNGAEPGEGGSDATDADTT